MPGAQANASLDLLQGRALRANPRYELVPVERLTAVERRQLADLRQEPDLYGVLRRRTAPGAGGAGAGAAAIAVDCETALLVLTLREPGPLPAYLQTAAGRGALRAVGRLIADGVLEIECGGAFVSGAAAHELLGAPGGRRPSGRLVELARAALSHAQALPVDDPVQLAAKLYGYNRRPLTPRWRRLLGSPGEVWTFLGLAAGGSEATARLAGRGSWSGPTRTMPWWVWRRARPGALAGAPGAADVYKLYVSPEPTALAGAGASLLAALAAAGPFQMKIGADARGLLRADKLVAYFSTFERLSAAAEALAGTLDGMPVQGVPFTAEISADGLVSWGVDPPAARSAWQRSESWRQRLTFRLARAIVAARAELAGHAQEPGRVEEATRRLEPWEFALARLRLDGIDTETWTPGALAWQEA
jgi:hypothetical protein